MVISKKDLELKFNKINKTSLERIEKDTRDYENLWNSLSAKDRLILESKV